MTIWRWPLVLLLLVLPACDDLRPPAVQVSDLDHFPAPAVVNAHLAFASQHIRRLEASLLLEPRNSELTDWLWEARRLRAVWQTLQEAQQERRESQTLTCHRLRELRDWLGNEDYFAGKMPPPVPLHRFREIR